MMLPVQLHFIQCVYPNQTQLGLNKYLQQIYNHLQININLVWKVIVKQIPDQILFGLKNTEISEDQNPKLFQFGLELNFVSYYVLGGFLF